MSFPHFPRNSTLAFRDTLDYAAAVERPYPRKRAVVLWVLAMVFGQPHLPKLRFPQSLLVVAIHLETFVAVQL